MRGVTATRSNAGSAPAPPVSAPALDLVAESARLEGATPEERLAFAVQTWGQDLLVTSSFGAGSGVLLHMWSRIAKDRPVVVIDTGFLFDETQAYIERLTRELGIVVERARPPVPRDEFLWQHGADVMARDPDFCCAQNKVAALAPYVARARGWVSGLRRDQSRTREAVPILQAGEDGPVKIHPLATMTAEQVRAYMEAHAIPEHPLVARRYLSIGCWPCTQPVEDGQPERAGRWAGRGKTECGIHAQLKARP
jgi:phosphoadenosine phosphosulfate reductase